jgi:hypothetical protein
VSRYRSAARIVARRSFAPGGSLAGEEIRVLVEELADGEDAEWLLEEGREEQRMAKFREAVEFVLRSYESRRMTPPLEQTSTTTFFRFAVREVPGEEPASRALRARLRLHDQMLDILRALDPDEFEQLCGRVLREAGCEAVQVTRSSQDLGTDFFGRIAVERAAPRTIGVEPRLRVLGGVYLLLFGQAKRYADYNKIKLDTVKVIEGSWKDILRRKLNGELPQHLEEGLEKIGWRAADGVTYVFVTTSSYTDPALTWASNIGMATLDGDQIAQFLLESAIGVEEPEEDAWQTSADLVRAACSV